MAERAGGAGSWRGFAIGLSALLVVGLVVRLALINVPGHNGDTAVMARWAEQLAASGPGSFYRHDGSIYPALLYALWPLGIAFDGPMLETVIKAISIPFDLLLAVVIAAVTLRLSSRGLALVAAAIYLLNPSVLLAGVVWGQVDAAGTLAFVGALAASAARRHAVAAGLGTLALLLKPQFGLVLLPVLVVAGLASLRERRAGPILAAGGAALGVAALVAVPLGLNPVIYAQQLGGVLGNTASASLYAMNPWGLLFGFETSERGLAPLGAALLLTGLALAVVPLRRRADLSALLATGAFVAFAFYFLPTRVHERYLFPATALLAPLAVSSARRLIAYLLLSAAFALTLLYALIVITPFSLPVELERLILARESVWVVSAVLIGSAVVWVVVLRRDLWPAAPASADLARDARDVVEPLDAREHP